MEDCELGSKSTQELPEVRMNRGVRQTVGTGHGATEIQKWENDPRQVERIWGDQLRPRQGIDGCQRSLGETHDRWQRGDRYEDSESSRAHSALGGQVKELAESPFTWENYHTACWAFGSSRDSAASDILDLCLPGS